jgi:RsiW-degrading membrane proteinase PrsW (M82 family)
MNKQNDYYLTLTTEGKLTHHLLSTEQVTIIGRESSCQVILDTAYREVSRRHIEIRPLMSRTSDGSPLWQACDLSSANGTYINGQRLQGCQTLQLGDRLVLGDNNAEFLFECKAIAKLAVLKDTVSHKGIAPPSKLTNQPLNIQIRPSDSLHFSHVLPIFSTRQDLIRKGYLIPGILTILIVIGLLATIGSPVIFNALLAIYLAAIGYYFIYQMAGKEKPWWLLIASALLTIIILNSFIVNLFILIFRELLPGNIEASQNDFSSLLVGMFFGAGLMEELLKAIPVFVALRWGLKFKPKSPWRERIGVTEPLDGILLGSASAIGFTLQETLGIYVPGTIQEVTSQYGNGVGELYGLHLLIPRIIGSIAGHMAYSGYFGYFIGLSMLKPSKRWLILSIGYLTSSALHAFWNASGAIHPLVTAVAGVLAYSFLLAAILKARKLSPTRSQNFATQYDPYSR